MDKSAIRVRMNPEHIYMLDNVIEGFDGLAIVSTGRTKTGEVTVHVTPDTYDEVMEILRNFPLPLMIMQ